MLTGWGRTPASAAHVHSLEGRDEVPTILEKASARGSIARGLGRSYGDAAQRSGGSIITLERHRAIDWLTDGRIRAEAGVSFDELIGEVVPRGFFVPVTPGTRQVTIGGAIAADIHGKNHHRDGSLADHLESVTLMLPDGEQREVSPADDAELFWATVGGMGLTGIILSAVVRLIPIETSLMVVETRRASDLEALMAAMAEGDQHHRYSVAWVDLVATGTHLGRGVIMHGDHAGSSDVTGRQSEEPLAYRPPKPRAIPWAPPVGLVNRWTARAFNELWYRKSPRSRVGQLQSIPSFFHPLDAISNWNIVYGPSGFLQYQFVVPSGASDTLVEIARRIASSGFPSSLTVLKRMGPGNDGLLSFPLEGWTLAVDFPVAEGIDEFLDRLDELVVGAGGRVYLAKDSRMRPEMIPLMYPRLDRFAKVRTRVDPKGLLKSDLAVRLQIP
jgi:decaprenylphospho-beta-D-ribofuranose 2-oxidase